MLAYDAIENTSNYNSKFIKEALMTSLKYSNYSSKKNTLTITKHR